MRIFGVPMRDRFKSLDPILLICMLFLSFVSIITIWSSADTLQNSGRIKMMQLAMTVAGMVLLFIMANIDYRFFVDRFAIIMLIGSIAILAITILFGRTGEGDRETANKSWLNLFGIISIQPSEFVKVTFICTFAKHIDSVKDRINRPIAWGGLLAHALLIIGLILMSGDLGVALVYMGMMALMLYFAGLSSWYFLGAGGILAIAFPFLWGFLRPDQQNRIIFGFQPELDPTNVGMQALMSKDAIASGGFFGRGMAAGGIYEDLPEHHTDFIFATICEKFGLIIGILTVIALIVIVIRLLWIALTCREFVGRLICGGIATIIIIQTLENLWMCLAIVPVVGITLPFLSYGGSSVLALYLLMGLAHSVGAQEKKLFFRREK